MEIRQSDGFSNLG